MKARLAAYIFSLLLAASVYADHVKVTGDRVNIRGASNLNSRVMGQVSKGTVLKAVSLGDTWVEILPPPDVFGWIHLDLVKDGVIIVPEANIRSGPGINYGILIRAQRATKLKVHGKFNKWLKITPPEGTSVWISRNYVEPLAESGKALQAVAESSLSTNSAVNVGVAPKPPMPASDTERISSPALNIPTHSLSSAGITSNMLVATVEQDVAVSRKGVLKKASLVWRRPSRYVLINPQAGQEDKTICYVTGSEPQLEAVLGKSMTIKGKEYTVQGARCPVLSAQKIILH